MSIDTVLRNPCECERVMEQVTSMGGEERAKHMLQSLDIDDPKKNYCTTWNFLCKSVPAIEEFQTKISESCSSLSCQKRTDLMIDDDKMQNRSAKAKEHG